MLNACFADWSLGILLYSNKNTSRVYISLDINSQMDINDTWSLGAIFLLTSQADKSYVKQGAGLGTYSKRRQVVEAGMVLLVRS